MNEGTRRKILSVAVSEDIEAKIRKVAQSEGLSMSSWIRSKLIREIRKYESKSTTDTKQVTDE